MKTSEVYTCTGNHQKGYTYEIEEYEQPFFVYLRGKTFHFVVCSCLQNKWTRWFWDKNWYHMVSGDALKEAKEQGDDWGWDGTMPLCCWMDIICHDLRNAKKSNSQRREITREEYMNHSRLARKLEQNEEN